MRGLLAMAVVALVACGVKAPPRPPERHAPGAQPEPAAAPTTASTCERCPTPTSTATPTPTSTTTTTTKP